MTSIKLLLRILFYGSFALLIIAAVMLPSFLELDTYRPAIENQVFKATHRRVTIGHLTAHLLPPGIVAERLVAFETDPPHRPAIVADQIRLRVQFRPLLHGEVRIETLILDRPRLIVYTDRLNQPSAPPTSGAGEADRPSLNILIHQGRIELGGPLFGRWIRWSIDNVEGRVEGTERILILSSRPSFLGPAARLSVRRDLTADMPFQADLKNARLDQMFSILMSTPMANRWRGSMVNAHIEAKEPVLQGIDVQIARLTLPPVPGASLRGSVHYRPIVSQIQADFDGLTSTMSVTSQIHQRNGAWDASAKIKRYAPEIVRAFTGNRWLNALAGPGDLDVQLSRQPGKGIRAQIEGRRMAFSGTRFLIPKWSAAYDDRSLDIRVSAVTREGDGRAAVRWVKRSNANFGTVDVSASTVTVRDVFDVFAWHPSKPIGIEPWVIHGARYEGPVYSGDRVEIRRATMTLPPLDLDARGTLRLADRPPIVALEGHVNHMKLRSVLEDLGINPAPATGITQADFNLQFSPTERWVETLSGRVNAQSADGFIRAGTVIYQIAGLLNLTHLLKPSARARVSGDGIPYQRATVTGDLGQGVFRTNNLNIATENMTITGKGQVDYVHRTIDADIKLQLIQFVKEALAKIPVIKRVAVPATGWVEVPVQIRGPLDKPQIK